MTNEELGKSPPTFEFHVRDLVRLVSGRLHAVVDDEVNISELLVVVVAAGSVPRLVVHGHADSLGLEPPPVAPPRRSASLLRRPGLATTRGCRGTKVKDLGTYPGAATHINNALLSLARSSRSRRRVRLEAEARSRGTISERGFSRADEFR